MKNKKIIFIILILLFFVFGIYLGINYYNKSVIKNVEVYKLKETSSYEYKKINISEEEKKHIINYLKKQSFKESKNILNCMTIGTYSIKFNNYEISFDDNSCVTYFINIKTDKYYQIDLTDELRDYVIKIAN